MPASGRVTRGQAARARKQPHARGREARRRVAREVVFLVELSGGGGMGGAGDGWENISGVRN